jgi:hypothetical protein
MVGSGGPPELDELDESVSVPASGVEVSLFLLLSLDDEPHATTSDTPRNAASQSLT